jgi:hypothetical protein
MNPDPLPPDLHDLEARLARRSGPEPADDLRARVLSAAAALRARTGATRPARPWRLVWQAAAAVVLALNLALCVGNGIRFQRLSPSAAPGDAAGWAAPVSREDALETSALAQLTPSADLAALGRRLFGIGENRTWDTP